MNNEMLSKIQKDIIIVAGDKNHAVLCSKIHGLEDDEKITVLVVAEKYITNSKKIFQDLVEILVYKEITYVALHGIITLFQEDWDKLVVEANSSIETYVVSSR